MADTKTTEQRHDAAMERIAKALGTTAIDLTGEARGDPALARALTMENIAAAVDKGKAGITLRAAVKAARDEDLMTLPGVGEKSVSALREWATAAPQSSEAQPSTPAPSAGAVQASAAPIAPTGTGGAVSSGTSNAPSGAKG